ncbi:MAG: A/G-specific adenine glycosylase [Lachnospiraceae bacterium]|nr:A/G-specific adenine glycosylase [Robinsoniella sp.]MDY3766536.1 A/G-specific adenine glycosylase [Lachnospiraceae bacterium]
MTEKIVKPLLKWYDENARILPWREEPTPYRVWVSEIMLQQTRVEAVKPFFERFVKNLPDITELAECEPERLLKLWEGLGYYNRVKNMQKAAIVVKEQYGGKLPDDYERLMSLPGIGSYTAGAIASIAYGIAVPAVDGNVLRVITRVTADSDDIMKQSVRRKVEDELGRIIPKERPGAFNQALMELGATVCVPNGMAKCEQCPLAKFCTAHIQGREMDFPSKKKKKERKIEEKTVLVIRDGERAAIRKRPTKGLLAGMYELPNLAGHLSEDEVLREMKEMNFSPIRIQKLGVAKHIFSHVEWHMIGYVVWVEESEDMPDQMILVEPEETEKTYPIPAAFTAYARYLNIRLGQEKYEKNEKE